MAITLEEFLNQHGSSLLSLAVSLAGSQAAGQDLLQESLIRVYPKWEQISEGAHLSYARRALVRHSVSVWRARRWREVSVEYLPEAPGGITWEEPIEDRTRLQAALLALPAKQRTAVVLRYVHDFSVEEASQLMDVPTGTLKSLCSRGLAALRAHPGLAIDITSRQESERA